MRHSAITMRGVQTNSCNVQGGLLLGKAAPEPNPYRRNLRSPRSLELGPIRLTLWASFSRRLLLGILAVTERHGLVAKIKSATNAPAVCFVQADNVRW